MAWFLRLGSKHSTAAHKDRYKKFMSAAKGHGYPVEKHFYRTRDDYINCAFRISGPKGHGAKHLVEKRPVMVLQHGLNDSCQFALHEGPDSLAPFFAEAGFDVWLNNSRGNCFSRHHKYLSADTDAEFWYSSFQELGKYDLTAFLDYVLNETGQEKVTYLGHSQGGTQILSGLADDADFFKTRVNLFLLLGPASRLDRCLHPNFLFACWLNEINPSLVQSPKMFGPWVTYLTSPFNFEQPAVRIICDQDPSLCSDVGLHNIGGHYQAGTSVRSITHFRQIYEAKRFQRFDFGSANANLHAYGQEEVPEIELSSFSDVPIGLFCGKSDLLVSPGDYSWLREELLRANNCAFFKEYELGHLGLVIPKDKTLFYDILALAKLYVEAGSLVHSESINKERLAVAEKEVPVIARLTVEKPKTQ